MRIAPGTVTVAPHAARSNTSQPATPSTRMMCAPSKRRSASRIGQPCADLHLPTLARQIPALAFGSATSREKQQREAGAERQFEWP